MRRRTRHLLAMLAIGGGLGVAVLLQVRHERVQARDPLTTIDPATLHRLRVECLGCTARVFERVDGQWRMREPQDVRADQAAVKRLIEIATAPVRTWHPRDAFDAAKVGLAPPQAVLTLDGRALRFGVTDAIDGDRYVDTGTAIALVPGRFTALLFEPAEREIARDEAVPAH